MDVEAIPLGRLAAQSEALSSSAVEGRSSLKSAGFGAFQAAVTSCQSEKDRDLSSRCLPEAHSKTVRP